MEDAGPRLALTFDDCDDPVAWAAILDVLSSLGARASFFPNGFRAERFPDVAARTVREGHTVGSHGWDHRRLRGLSPEEVRRRLLMDRELWERLTAVSLRFMRPPMGDHDETTLAAAAAARYTDMVLWDVDPVDWRDRRADLIVDRVLGEARGGSIVELHALPETAEALPRILQGLRERGLEPDALDGLVPG